MATKKKKRCSGILYGEGETSVVTQKKIGLEESVQIDPIQRGKRKKAPTRPFVGGKGKGKCTLCQGEKKNGPNREREPNLRSSPRKPAARCQITKKSIRDVGREEKLRAGNVRV